MPLQSIVLGSATGMQRPTPFKIVTLGNEQCGHKPLPAYFLNLTQHKTIWKVKTCDAEIQSKKKWKNAYRITGLIESLVLR